MHPVPQRVEKSSIDREREALRAIENAVGHQDKEIQNQFESLRALGPVSLGLEQSQLDEIQEACVRRTLPQTPSTLCVTRC